MLFCPEEHLLPGRITDKPIIQKGNKMKMKKTIALALTFVMLLALGVTAYAAPATTGSKLTDQISLIYQNFGSLKQDDTPVAWLYSVTDLDHNGRLELMAASTENALSGQARLKMWEVNQDGNALEVISHENTGKGDLFVNLMTDSADTAFDAETKAWYYIFPIYAEKKEDNADSVQNRICGINKHGTQIDCGTLAVRNSIIRGDQVEVSILDKDKNPISEEQFLNVVNSTFAGKQRSNTSFDWFRSSEAASIDRFINSYSVFDGSKTLSQSASAYNIPTTAVSLSVTKNPTNEYRSGGDTAIFIANAVNYTGLYWTFVDPKGTARSAQEFINACGGSVGGQNSTDLYIYNVNTNMNGWGVYCTFQGKGNQSVRTATAYLYIRYDQNQLHNKRSNLEDFYRNSSYLYGYWICPICDSEVWGDYCTWCGFDPDYYYTVITSGYVTDNNEEVPWYGGFDPEAYTDSEFLMTFGMTKDEYYRAIQGYEENPNYYVDDGYVPDWIEDGYDPYAGYVSDDIVDGYDPYAGYVPDWIEDGYDPYAYAYDYDDVWGADDGYALDWD